LDTVTRIWPLAVERPLQLLRQQLNDPRSLRFPARRNGRRTSPLAPVSTGDPHCRSGSSRRLGGRSRDWGVRRRRSSHGSGPNRYRFQGARRQADAGAAGGAQCWADPPRAGSCCTTRSPRHRRGARHRARTSPNQMPTSSATVLRRFRRQTDCPSLSTFDDAF